MSGLASRKPDLIAKLEPVELLQDSVAVDDIVVGTLSGLEFSVRCHFVARALYVIREAVEKECVVILASQILMHCLQEGRSGQRPLRDN